MINRRFTTIAIALAAISASAGIEATASKPFMSRNKSGFAICRNIGAAPKVTVCVSGKPGSGRVSTEAIKSAVISIKKMALVYGSKYSTLSANAISKFDTIAPGQDPTEPSTSPESSPEATAEEEASSTEEPYNELMGEAPASGDEIPESVEDGLEPDPMEDPETVTEPDPMEDPETVTEPDPMEDPETVIVPDPMEDPETVIVPDPMEDPETVSEADPMEDPECDPIYNPCMYP